LGSLAAKSLIEKKVEKVEILASSKIPVEELIHFYRSFRLKNYEYSEKSYLDHEIDKESND